MTLRKHHKEASEVTASNLHQVVMILIDALPVTYLSKRNAPFLCKISEGCISLIHPLFAFRGIEATLFTGVDPDHHGIWTEFRLKQSVLETYRKGVKPSGHTAIESLLKAVDMVPNDKLRKVARFGFQRIFKKTTLQMAHLIPAEALELFEPSLEYPIFTEKALIMVPTLFDILRANNLSFECIAQPLVNNDREVLWKVQTKLSKPDYSKFWYIKFSALDEVGHKFGPSAEITRKYMRKVDSMVKIIVEEFMKNDEYVSFIILSDHGMCDVRGVINLQKYLNKLDVKAYRDYLVFLDSTMARFWFFNAKADNDVTTVLQNLNHGHILSYSEKKELKIPRDERYGKLIFTLDEGYVIHPSYFHASWFPKGMHGFAYASSPDSYSPLIVYGSEVSSEVSSLGEKVECTDVFKLLSCLLS